MIPKLGSWFDDAKAWYERLSWLWAIIIAAFVGSAVTAGTLVATDDPAPQLSPDSIDAQIALSEGRFERAEDILFFEAYVGGW